MEARNWLLDNGFTDHRIVVLPGHETNEDVQDACRALNVMTASGIIGDNLLPPQDQYMLKYKTGDAQSLATLQGHIDRCETNKTWITILFHHVATEAADLTVQTSVLDSLLSYTQGKDVTVATYSDVITGNV